jgi:ketosteroid isomerase-like protein
VTDTEGGSLASLEAANLALYAAVEAADFESMSALWVDGPAGDSSVCVHPGWPAVVGRGQVLRAWALIMANTTYIQFFLTDVCSWVVDDVGIVSCQENILTGLDAGPSGGVADLSGGRVVATNVFRRTPQGWRAWLHHASPVLTADDTGETDDTDDAGADGGEQSR